MNKTHEVITKRLAAALDASAAATPHEPTDNPYVNHTVEQLAQGTGILKGADHIPAKNMAPEGALGYLMEVKRNENLARGRTEKATARKAQARARAARTLEVNAIADSEVTPSPERMMLAWHVVFPLVTIINQIANSKKQWASRFLGSSVDDIAQMALEKTALVLAKSDHDLTILRQAAEELGDDAKTTGRVPADQLTDDERKERREVKKARKWLMGMVNNRVMGALVDSYTDQKNLRWDNIDIIATVIASINGSSVDPMTTNFKANRSPAMLGTVFVRPGGIDGAVLAATINAAITERGLDPLVELLLLEENRRTDGAIRWTKCARDIFLATPGGEGAWYWESVVLATTHHKHPPRAQGDAARTHVRNLFAFLPSVIMGAIDAFDHRAIAYTTSRPGGHAVMASDFELFYLGDTDERRYPLQPKLQYASPDEAAFALVTYLSELVTGEDLISSVVNT